MAPAFREILKFLKIKLAFWRFRGDYSSAWLHPPRHHAPLHASLYCVSPVRRAGIGGVWLVRQPHGFFKRHPAPPPVPPPAVRPRLPTASPAAHPGDPAAGRAGYSSKPPSAISASGCRADPETLVASIAKALEAGDFDTVARSPAKPPATTKPSPSSRRWPPSTHSRSNSPTASAKSVNWNSTP